MTASEPPTAFPQGLRPDADELVAGELFGSWGGAAPWPTEPAPTLRAAVEASLLDALAAGPCFVAFSGGVDSSVVLAIAAQVARREGLPLPVPLTLELPGDREADERDWQRSVLAHLGLEEGGRIDGRASLDFFGDQAATVHRAIGCVSPITLHSMRPLLEAARGGTLVTGSGGDELMRGEAVRLSSALRSGLRPTRRGWLDLAYADIPSWAMALRIRWESDLRETPWLRRAARSRLLRREIEAYRTVPRTFDASLWMLWATREFQSSAAAMPAVAGALGAGDGGAPVRVREPFYEAGAIAALAREYGARFPGSRGRIVHATAGELLPRELVLRESKASFTGAYFGPATRAWLEGWDGRGVDPARADWRVLKRLLESGELPYAGWMPVLAAWLATGDGS